MKKILISLLLLFTLFFSSCASDSQQVYVKNIYFSKAGSSYEITFQTYDFSSREEAYQTYKYASEDIFKSGITAMLENNFNFRLCENILIDGRLFYSDFDKVFSEVNQLKIPPSTNVLCTIGETDESLKTDKLIKTPLYDFSTGLSGASGIVGITDKAGKNLGALIIDQGDVIKVISEKQWKILNMITGDKSGFSCSFRDGEIFAVFDKCDVYYSTDDNLQINITVSLRDYKGINNSESSIEIMKEFISNEISDTVYRLYNDATIKNLCNLDWFSRIKDYNGPMSYVNVKIV